MKFVVKPQADPKQAQERKKGYTTQCVLCSEDPRWCI